MADDYEERFRRQQEGAPVKTNGDLYDTDFYLWCLDTCATLGAHELEALDIPHLIEEIRDLGHNVRSALESDLGIVMLHLLKWQYQPSSHQESHRWEDSIVEHRRRITRLLKRSPSLKAHLATAVEEEYPTARRRAAAQIRLPLTTFPPTCPWTAEQIQDERFWPLPEDPAESN